MKSTNEIVLNVKLFDFLSDGERKYLDKITSDKTGIINAICIRKELEKFDLHMFQALTAKSTILFNNKREVSSGGLGIDFNEAIAFKKAIGESVERYCLSFTPTEELVFSSWSNLSSKVKLNKLYAHSEEQYIQYGDNLKNWTDGDIHWIKIQALWRSKKVFYPASLIYVPFEKQLPISESSSTGVASHSSLGKALKNGLMEIIQRDAMMINHYQQLCPSCINIDTIKFKKKQNQDLFRKIRDEYNIKIYKLYSDINIPIFLSYIWINSSETFHYGIGADANLNSEAGLIKSLQECLFTFFYTKNLVNEWKVEKKKIFLDCTNIFFIIKIRTDSKI